ncbi:4'-phosphopantetheinyl transferase family protein [Rhizobium rhizogenes]|uniref:4'-phosphopantetheinyl transferase family protein n=1 Tax=Rhizobium rhizogenes TaxID=359 RepID=UPI0015748FBE|nr:4'-phosphopantetheinyl transferase superfamily protein [Rhizobium rhizogenes]NTG02968.1 4'-phosphopantetheinyl transferase superfamily protein [Rhizobium rhizogenes]NTG10031.1 4'-phosphopantetheinyl transferase superfamily protein [Rhizobium rhizogenes]
MFADLNKMIRAPRPFRTMLPADITTLECYISSVNATELNEQELECVRGAAPKCQREFAAGRKLAREALRSFGIRDFPLLSNPDRSPKWPESILGSITHSSDHCAVAVASAKRYRGIGIDIQEIETVGPGLWRTFCTEIELRHIERSKPHERQHRAALIFSAKESYFKAQFPREQKWSDFLDFAVFPTANQFEVVPVRESSSSMETIVGRYEIEPQRVRTSVVLRATPV